MKHSHLVEVGSVWMTNDRRVPLKQKQKTRFWVVVREGRRRSVMKHSRFVRIRKTRRDGVAAVYWLSEPIEYGGGYGDDEEENEVKTAQYVWVSAVPHVGGYEGPETFAFPFDNEKDEVLNWAELPGSYKGGMSHRKCLDGLGFPCSDIPPEVEAAAEPEGRRP